MARTNRGLEYEHELASDIFELSEGRIIPLRSGWSGNQGLPSPDLLIPFGGALIAAEIKTTSSDTSLIIKPEDLDEIRYWTMRMSEVPTYPYLFIKFTGHGSRAIYPTRLTRVSDPQRAFELETERCPFDCKITRTGNLSFRKPETDEWPSMQAAGGPTGMKDAHQVLETLRNDEFEQPSVLDVIKQRDDFFETLGSE